MAESADGFQKIVVPTPAKFNGEVEKHKNDEKGLFVLFFGERKEDGESWCPDCARALPIISAALSKHAPGSTMLEVTVPREAYKNNPDYHYRKHDLVKLPSIPYLIRWTSSGPQDTLGEEECQQEETVEKFVKKD